MHLRSEWAPLRAVAFCVLAGVRVNAQAQTSDQLRREIASVGVVEKLGATVPRDAVLTVARAWRFAVASKPDVDALADAVGFRYRSVPETGEFAHQATVVVLEHSPTPRAAP